MLDATTGGHVSGGRFELLDEDGEAVLDFEMGEARLSQTTMAVPVGVYTLRQIEAADGYALCETDEITVDIPPYLTQGGTAAEVNLTCLSLPETEEIDG